MPITPDDVRPGIAVFLEPRALRADPRTVIRVHHPKSIVDTHHYFICLRTAAHDLGLWIPCFSRHTAGRVLIPREVKFGHPTWAADYSYHYRNQAWTFTHHAAASASADDLSSSPRLNGILPEAAAQIERLLVVEGTRVIQSARPPHSATLSPAGSGLPNPADRREITTPSSGVPSPSASPLRTEPC